MRGVPRHVLDLATHLDKERFEVEVLSGRGDVAEGSLWEEAADLGVVTHRLDALQRALNPIADLRAYRAILDHVMTGKYDVVHTHISKAGFLGRLAANRVGVPRIIHTYHGSISELQGTGFVSKVLRQCERHAAKVSSALIAVSEDVKQNMLSMGVGVSEQYSVIPNGIELNFFDKKLEFESLPDVKGRPLLGYVGSLTTEKGLDVLLCAMSQLANRFPEAHLYLVGDGPLRRTLRMQAESLNIGGRVCFVGTVSDVRPWLAAFDVLVLPSRSEGMGRVLLEAMAMEVPVLATRVGGIVEIIKDGENGILVESDSAEKLFLALSYILSSDDLREKLSGNGLEFVTKNFRLESVVSMVAQIYTNLRNV